MCMTYLTMWLKQSDPIRPRVFLIYSMIQSFTSFGFDLKSRKILMNTSLFVNLLRAQYESIKGICSIEAVRAAIVISWSSGDSTTGTARFFWV